MCSAPPCGHVWNCTSPKSSVLREPPSLAALPSWSVPWGPEVKQVPGLPREGPAQMRRNRMRVLIFPATVQCFRSPTAVIALEAVPCRWRWDKACTASQVRCFCENKVTRLYFPFFFFQKELENCKLRLATAPSCL